MSNFKQQSGDVTPMEEVASKQSSFFLSTMIPKEPTQCDIFLKANRTFDGRGVRVGVLDTGVDPGASGLLKTTTGKPKLIDIRDCSGDGDVEILKVVQAREQRSKTGEDTKEVSDILYLDGFRGETLKISRECANMNPSNKWFLGEKNLFASFPKAVRSRLAKKYEERQNAFHTLLKQSVDKDLEDPILTPSERKDLEIQKTLLEKPLDLESETFVTTCIVFEDVDGILRAMIDKSGDGNFTKTKVFASYRLERQFDTWDEISQLNYCVNIECDNIEALRNGVLSACKLTVICDNSSHGTHVASILAGCHPENPKLHGIAPGAEVVSLRIGDGRLGTMETTKSVVKAISLAVQLGCDIVNMSFGEASTATSQGRVIEVIDEAVKKHGLIFVTSASNSGPALSTIGAPASACSSNSTISVGAYLDKNMKLAQYGKVEASITTNEHAMFDWSSRGPSYDAGLGVTICAPGGAVASVPAWVLHQKDQKNGTSMASPNACGAICLILSGLKQKRIRYSPVSIKRCVENSAKKLDMEVFGQGNGLLQVNSAFELLVNEHKYHRSSPQAFVLDLPFDIDVISSRNVPTPDNGGLRGIFLCQPDHVHSTSTHKIRLRPLFNLTENYSRASNSKGYAYNNNENFPQDPDFHRGSHVITRWPNRLKNQVQLKLTIETDVPWVKATEQVLYHGSETVNLLVDPRDLSPGIHFTWVKILEAESKSLGPLFKIPVTVIIPEDIETKKGLEFIGGTVHRTFLAVPEGASVLDLSARISTGNIDTHKRLFYFVCTQLRPHSSYRSDMHTEYRYVDSSQSNQDPFSFSFPVSHPGMVEITCCQSWQTNGSPLHMDLSANFQGVLSSKSEFVLDNEPNEVVLNNFLGNCVIKPHAKYHHVERTVPAVGPAKYVSAWDNDILPYEYQKFSGQDVKQDTDSEATGLTRSSATLSRLKSLYDTLKKNPTKNIEFGQGGGIGEIRRSSTRMIMEYEFTITEKASAQFSLPLHSLLYESPLDCHMVMIYNQDKKLILCSDAYPTFNSIPAGKYTARVCLSHESRDMLKRYESLSLKIRFKVSIPVELDIYASFLNYVNQKPVRGNLSLPENESRSLFFAQKKAKSPAWTMTGDCLVGHLHYFSNARNENPATIRYFLSQDFNKDEQIKDTMAQLQASLNLMDLKSPAPDSASDSTASFDFVSEDVKQKIKLFKKNLSTISLEKIIDLYETVDSSAQKDDAKAYMAKLAILRLRLKKVGLETEDPVFHLKQGVHMEKILKKELTAVSKTSGREANKYTDSLSVLLVAVFCLKNVVSLRVSPKDDKIIANAEADLTKIETLGAKSKKINQLTNQFKMELYFSKGEYASCLEALGNIDLSDDSVIPIRKDLLWKKKLMCYKRLNWFHMVENSLRKQKIYYPLSYQLY